MRASRRPCDSGRHGRNDAVLCGAINGEPIAQKDRADSERGCSKSGVIVHLPLKCSQLWEAVNGAT